MGSSIFKKISKNAEPLILALVVAGDLFLGGSKSFLSVTKVQTFPFFSWSLYDGIPETVSEYDIVLPQLGGKSLIDVLPKGDIVYNRYLVQSFGSAYVKDSSQASALLSQIRALVDPLRADTLVLELLQGNPIEYYETGSVNRRQIATIHL